MDRTTLPRRQFFLAMLSLAGCSQIRQPDPPAHQPASNGPLAPDFTGGGAWINSEPLTMEGLRGKVVLVDFWTYG